jgi:hypothetical protein
MAAVVLLGVVSLGGMTALLGGDPAGPLDDGAGMEEADPEQELALPGPGEDPARPDRVLFVNVAVLVLSGLLAALVWRLRDPLRRLVARRRSGAAAGGAVAPRLESLREGWRGAELRFKVLSTLLVLLSGISVLYVGKPGFGTPGDYLAVLLWGTAVGEGVKLARRFLPVR